MNVLLFTGAGIAVPLKLPTTTEFKSVLNQIDSRLRQHLQEYLDKNNEDIEHVLSALELLQKGDSFVYNILQQKSKSDGNFQAVTGYFSQIMSAASGAVESIKSSIFNVLERYDDQDAATLFINLLAQLQSVGGSKNPISIFTTNYDLTFETADLETASFEKLGISKIDYGFRVKSSTNCFDKSVNYDWAANSIEYKKLHGSIDWQINRKRIIKLGSTVQPASPGKMPLLYPGYKGTPEEEPFKTFHDQLLQRLLVADLVVIVGFAFRDPYINNMFDTALRINANARFYCFNPASNDRLPKESAIQKFKVTYPRFKHVEEGISLQEKPIDISTIENDYR